MYWRFLLSLLFLCMGDAVILAPVPAYADAPAISEAALPDQHMLQGWRSFQSGAFAEAVRHWLEAAHVYQQAGQPSAQSAALVQLARAYQSVGQYQQALKSLERALGLAKQAGDRRRVAVILKDLGSVYIVTGPVETAQRYLDEGLRIAREVQDKSLAAAILHNLGNAFAAQAKYDDALATYTESVKLTQQTGNRALAVRALINAAVVALQHAQPQEARARLDMAAEQMPSLAPAHDKAYSLISLGLAYNDLRLHLPEAHDRLLLLAAGAFNDAAQVAQALGDAQATSYAWGYLGQLYEAAHRYQEALQLTRRAVFTAQQVHTPQSLYLWQWQTGRLFTALGDIEAAIAAYRRAIGTLQSIRQEISAYGGTPSFRKAVRPVYFGLVDLLLQRAASLQKRAEYESYLIEARNTVELFKVAELQDYLQDQCVQAAHTTIALEGVSQTAVVVYPILLPDRTELLVSLPTGLERFTVPVGADTVTQEAKEFRAKLAIRITHEYLLHARKLYDWLVRPFEQSLVSLPIDTLVFVPDGALQTIPMAALHNGTQFLVNKYAVATTPGLNLTDPRPLPREKTKVLAVGLSEAVSGFPALPYVSKELEAIHSLYGGKILLDQDFLVSNVEKALQHEQFTVLHIASHAQFAGNVEQSFILTHGGKLTMDRLGQLMGFLRFRDQPLELLALSAGETAVGDDRAALGLAGIAIRTGVRSVLATLWRVPDEAASVLVTEFYQQLRDPAVSRAVALQRAQLKLLRGELRYRHPWWWAPFLLLNNWL